MKTDCPKKSIIFGAFLLSVHSLCLATIIPINRVTTWQGNVGVEGGIPNSSNMTVFVSLTPASGLTAINNALASCPSNKVVQLSAGTYAISGVINIVKNGAVLRGAGPGATVINFSGSGGIVARGSALLDDVAATGRPAGHAVDWTNGYAQGGKTIVLGSVAGLTVGQLLCLDQVNDNKDVDARSNAGSSALGCDNCGRSSSTRSQEQWVKVRAIKGHNVTLSAPLYMPNWRSGQTPQAWWQDGSVIEKSGIENMTLDGTSSSGVGVGYNGNIYLASAYNCWVKNVASRNSAVSHINPFAVARCEIRHCSFYGGQGVTHRSYGVLFMGCSGVLMEDNVFEQVTAPFVGGLCPSGNVVSYNYATNNFYLSEAGVAFQNQTIITHDPHNNMLLCEGNYGNGFYGDVYHGSMGYTTLFRNRFTGYDRGVANNAWCVYLGPKNRNVNVVGNVLGKPGWTIAYSGCDAQQIYGLGCGNQFGLPDDPMVANTAFIHGNYDVINNSIVWSVANPDHAIPASLLYDSKPAWFGDRPWPPFEPANGALITANTLAMTNIPAGFRYVYGVDPPCNQPPAAAANATPRMGDAPLAVAFSSAGSSDPEGVPLSFNWTFGDGAPASSMANPIHTYESAGAYLVKLSVSDGTNSSACDLVIRVGIQVPVAVATANPVTGLAPLDVSFSSAGSFDYAGAPLAYLWTFGDGGTSTAPNVTHTYTSLGTFVARLSVSDINTTAMSSDLQISVNSSLVAAYGFEEGQGATAADSTSNNNTGTLINNPVWTDLGKFGKAIEFNGTNSYVSIAHSASINLTTGITVMAWCYPNRIMESTSSVVSKGTDVFWLGARATPNRPRFSAGNGVNGAAELPLHEWTHLAGSYDGANVRLYVNGTLVSSQSRTGLLQTASSNLGIGGDPISGQYWAGRIDEIRVYNRALGSGEIQADMIAPVVGPNSRPTAPVNLRVVKE